MKFKTLKDMEGRKDYDFRDDWLYRRSELKQEAIKWIETDFYNMPMFKDYCNDYDGAIEEGVKKWIKEFFNITEEECK